MIYVRDKGQMCNNILQFAHVYAFARENGRRAVSMRFSYNILISASASRRNTISCAMSWQSFPQQQGGCLL